MTTPRYRNRDEMLDGFRRQLKALPAYAAETGELDLCDFRALARMVRDAEAEFVTRLVVDQGWSWGQVGRELNMTRQAARKHWGHLAVAGDNQGRNPRRV